MLGTVVAPLKGKEKTPNLDSTVAGIHMSFDYEKFKTLKGNRIINTGNLERIKQSMKEEHLLSPIMVNEKFEIIDGQHRYEASKTLSLPIYYFIQKGAALPEVQRLNAVGKNWNFQDYLDSYCELGYKEYLKVRKFREDFSDFGIKATLSLLRLTTEDGRMKAGIDSKTGKLHGDGRTGFADGRFTCANLSRSYELASQLISLKNLTEFYNRSNFVSAYIAVSKKEGFDYRNFKYKVSKYPTKVYDCTNTKNYLAMIEDLYNYRNTNKVNLRY